MFTEKSRHGYPIRDVTPNQRLYHQSSSVNDMTCSNTYDTIHTKNTGPKLDNINFKLLQRYYLTKIYRIRIQLVESQLNELIQEIDSLNSLVKSKLNALNSFKERINSFNLT